MSAPSVGESLTFAGGAEGGQANRGRDQLFDVAGSFQRLCLEIWQPGQDFVQRCADLPPTLTVDDDVTPREVTVSLGVECPCFDRLGDPGEIGRQNEL